MVMYSLWCSSVVVSLLLSIRSVPVVVVVVVAKNKKNESKLIYEKYKKKIQIFTSLHDENYFAAKKSRIGEITIRPQPNYR